MAASAQITINTAQSSAKVSYKNLIVNSTDKVTSSKSFKDTLNSKTSTKDTDSKEVSSSNKDNAKQVDDTDANNQVDDTDTNNQVDDNSDEIKALQDKLEELEEESESDSDDKTNDVLTELMNLLAQLGLQQKNLTTDVNVNSNNLQEILGNTGEDSTSIIDTIAKLLQTDSIKDKLDTNSLKSMEKILENLSNNSNTSKEVKSSVNDLMSQISKQVDDKQNQNDKVLTLADLLNKNYSQDGDDSSTNSGNSSSNTSLNNKDSSKEDKFLNSLVDDDKGNTTDKMSLFVSRNEAIQNQGVADVSKNITINKSTFVQDLIQDVKYMSSNGLKELTVKINPENLGEMTISLTQEDGTMKATLKATSKDTANLLMQNLSEIKNQLNDKNIKIDDVNIELYQEDTTFFKNGNFDGQSSQNQQKNTSTTTNGDNDIINNSDHVTEEIQSINDGNIDLLV